MDAYIEALCMELSQRADGKSLKTIYFGGGTPSLLSLGQLGRIVDVIRTSFDTSCVEEATIEANPENLTADYLKGLAELHFFNRISIGIQSFDDKELKMLNRVHGGRQAVEAVRNVAAAGFNNLSVDLMMGLPRPYSVGLQYSLDALKALLPLGVVKHLSCYELTVEQGTILEKQLDMGRLQMPEDEELASQYEMLARWCRKHDFEQYEVSNFSLPGWHSRHNSRYWNRTPYIGVGAAAHSFDGTKRRWNAPDIKQYIEGAKTGKVPFEEETLTADDAYNEYVMTSLRTTEGIAKTLVADDRLDYLHNKIQPFVSKNLIVETETHYRPTAEGIMRADGIAASLFA